MNKNTLVSDRLNELYKKYFQSTDYKVGDSFESVKKNMSAEDYDTSQKLLNYYSQQNSLADQYNYSNKVVEQERNKALQENSIAKEKTMKYLPEYLKLQGMGGLGLSESSIISANNNYRNQRNTINANADSQKADLLEKYNANINTLDQNAISDSDSIRAKYQAIRDEEILGQYNNFVELLNNGGFNNMDEVNGAYNAIKGNLTDAQRVNAENQIASFDSKLQKQQTDQLYNNFVDKLNYGEFNTTEELENYYNSVKDKFDDTQKSILQDKIDYYKNNLEQQQLEAERKEKAEKESAEAKKQAEKDERIISGKEFVSYGGSNYKLTTQLNSDSNEIAHNNSFKERLKNLGYSNPYDENIPNGTTIEIKCDSYGKDEFDFVKDVLGTGFNPIRNITNIWGAITGVDTGYTSFSSFKKTLTYYNGNWYISTKQ